MEGCQEIGEDEAFKPPPTFLDKCDESQRFSTEIATPLSILMPRLARNRGGLLTGSSLRKKAVSPSAKPPHVGSRLSRDNPDPPTTHSPACPSPARSALRSTRNQPKNGLESRDISRTFEDLKVSFHPKSHRLKECYSTSPTTSPPDSDNVTRRHRSSPHSLVRPMLSRVSTPSGFLSSSPSSISPSPVQNGAREQTEESLESCIPNLPPIPGVRVSPFFHPVLAASPSASNRQGGGTAGSPSAHSLRSLPEKASPQSCRHSQEEEEAFRRKLVTGVRSRDGTRVSPRSDSIQCIPSDVSASPIGGFRKCPTRQHARPPSITGVPQTSCTTTPRSSKTYNRGGGQEPIDYSAKGNGDVSELRQPESTTHTLDCPEGRHGLTSGRGGSGGGVAGEGRQSASDRELLLELLNHGDSVSPAAFVKLRQSLNRAKKSKRVDSLKDWTDTSKVRLSRRHDIAQVDKWTASHLYMRAWLSLCTVLATHFDPSTSVDSASWEQGK